MLVARDLWKSYGAKPAVSGVSLEAKAGEIVGLLGPNGAGKSTTVAMVCGLTHPDRGEVAIDGAPMGEDASPAKRRVGLVPQDISLFEDLSAQGNLELFGALYGQKGEVLKSRVASALALVGLSDRAAHSPNELSGGQQQRVAIARALVADPTIIVADEPTGDLDRKSADDILELLHRLVADFQKTILMVTHDPRAAERAHATLHLDKGVLTS